LLNVLDICITACLRRERRWLEDEFYFNETITFTFHIGLKVKNLAEFLLRSSMLSPQLFIITSTRRGYASALMISPRG